jgi:hypothetical protein
MSKRRRLLSVFVTVFALGMQVGCATNKPEMSWVRTDGRRIVDDPDLLKQGQTDIALCHANLDTGVVDQGGARLYGQEGLRSRAQRPGGASTSRICDVSPAASYDTVCDR